MIGLKRGIVKVVPFDKKWAVLFDKEKKLLRMNLGRRVVNIQHIGSTSVPGLAAKPIIDISIGTKRFKDAIKLVKLMKKSGYEFYQKFGRQVLFAKGPDSSRTHYVHVMRYQGAKWKTDMLFRDYLRAHSDRMMRYAKLKKKLAQQYPSNRKAYTAGKDAFIKATLRKAIRNKN